MRYNGLQLVIDMALCKLAEPALQRYRDALVLGAIREDVCWLSWRQRLWEHWSLSHFSGAWLPGGFLPLLSVSAATAAQRRFRRARMAWLAGDAAAAHVHLGRASHLLIDMACPAHAARVAHWSDGYEWAVETHAGELRRLPISVPEHYRSVHAVVEGLARHTRQFPADGTHHYFGRWLRRRGWRQSLSRETCAVQARALIPVAAGHLAAMYRMFQAMQREAPRCS